MNATKEGGLWQAVGLASCLGGAAFLARVIAIYGVALVDPSSLSLGLAASFMMLAGAAAFFAGRVMAAIAGGARRLELLTWKVVAVVAMLAGAAKIYLVHRASLASPLAALDHIATGLAGSFVIMVGIMALLAQRLMRQLGKKASPLADRPTDEFPAVQPKK
ncbi:MAG: hypothetical protein ACRD24_00485 [Terriglobales bacterium]